jgi:hypothetical protein
MRFGLGAAFETLLAELLGKSGFSMRKNHFRSV